MRNNYKYLLAYILLFLSVVITVYMGKIYVIDATRSPATRWEVCL